MVRRILSLASILTFASYSDYASAKVIEIIANGNIETHIEEQSTHFDLRPYYWGSVTSPNASGVFTWVHERGAFQYGPVFHEDGTVELGKGLFSTRATISTEDMIPGQAYHAYIRHNFSFIPTTYTSNQDHSYTTVYYRHAMKVWCGGDPNWASGNYLYRGTDDGDHHTGMPGGYIEWPVGPNYKAIWNKREHTIAFGDLSITKESCPDGINVLMQVEAENIQFHSLQAGLMRITEMPQ